MRSIVTDVPCVYACVGVHLSVCWTHWLALQTRLNQSRCRLGCGLWGPRNHVLRGALVHLRKRGTWGSYLRMPRLARRQYSQRYSQGDSSDATTSYR